MWAQILPFCLAAILGFRHAFETDHLVAVSSIVTKRNSIFLSMKDGTFWGLGHGFSILIVALIVLGVRYSVPDQYFQLLEGAVGLMIVLLGIFRMWQFFKQQPLHFHRHGHEHSGKTHSHFHFHLDSGVPHDHQHSHKISFGVGILHGLAGSGVLIVSAMAAMKTIGSSLLFLTVFSLGCILGMISAAALLGLPFSKKLQSFVRIQQMLVILSCIFCLVLGSKIAMQNWHF